MFQRQQHNKLGGEMRLGRAGRSAGPRASHTKRLFRFVCGNKQGGDFEKLGNPGDVLSPEGGALPPSTHGRGVLSGGIPAPHGGKVQG